MKTALRPSAPCGGYAILVVLVLCTATILTLRGVLEWTHVTGNNSSRTTDYYVTASAAEAATQRVYDEMCRDFNSFGVLLVEFNLSSYRRLVPTPAQNPVWQEFQFSNGAGTTGENEITRLSSGYREMASRYPELRGDVYSYQIRSDVIHTNSAHRLACGYQQQVSLASVPVFGFGVFYNTDLEIHPSTEIKISGHVHVNGNLYAKGSVQFQKSVTASKQIVMARHPLDPVTSGATSVSFLAARDEGVNTFSIPIGVSNSPANLHKLIEFPAESRLSPLGLQRLYNRADLIIVVSNTTTFAISGSYNNFSTSLNPKDVFDHVTVAGNGNGQGGGKDKVKDKKKKDDEVYVERVVSTNNFFWDRRENRWIYATQIDLAMLRSDSTIRSALGREPRTIYVADMRTRNSSRLNAVRLVNGATLPPYPLTIVSPNPIYICGNYNVNPAVAGGVTAAVLGDAITVLSDGWDDDQSTEDLDDRVGSSTTINASLAMGIVATTNGNYSGGLENAVRLLEDWTGRTLQINGSLVVLYHSEIATAPWNHNSDEIYLKPTRRFVFDPNLLDSTKLPPSTPYIRTAIRANGRFVAAQR